MGKVCLRVILTNHKPHAYPSCMSFNKHMQCDVNSIFESEQPSK